MILLQWLSVVKTLSISEKIKAVKVMVTMLVNEASNNQKDSSMMMAPW